MNTLTRFVLTLIAATAIQAVTAIPARADVYLVGAQLYSAGSQGQTSSTYQYSTNSSTTHAPFLVDGGSGLPVSFLLSGGNNIFTFSPPVGRSSDPGAFVGLNLFFNTTGTSFNPPTGTIRAGDLTVSEATGSSLFFTPGAGTSIISYGTSGTSFFAAPANGLASFLIDGKNVSVAALSADHAPSGFFTINVAAVPDTGSSLALMVLAIAALFAFRTGQRKVA